MRERASPGKMNDFHNYGATTRRRVPEVDSVALEMTRCLEKVSKNLVDVQSHILQPLMNCTQLCLANTVPPRGQRHCGTKAAMLDSESHPINPSLPPLGIFLVQWPPFTTITQISWAGVILSIAPRCLEEGACV